MMVKPPGYLRRTGVLEVNNCVLVACEVGFIEKSACTVQQAVKDELHVFANAFLVEASEKRGRTSPIKTLIVVEDLNSHSVPFLPAGQRTAAHNQK